ncbi:hypothetical protein JCM33374_g6520 [Metschnikowia sp. JCM 33374]|nr:hypothetical protein JCM33374_g6520 [Metschnikowia sp. JCM 33374]
MSTNGIEARKNPFAPRKATTVKRGKDEVYPHRKGLNRPEFIGNSPLDLLFQELEATLPASLDHGSVEKLGETLFPSHTSASLYDLRYMVVDKLLGYLVEVQEFALQASANARTQT